MSEADIQIGAPGASKRDSLKEKASFGQELFDKLARVPRILSPLRQGDVDPLTLPIEKVLSPTEAIVCGQPTIMFGTNNYLGMNFEPSCVSAAAEAVQTNGIGTTASRVASGSHAGHIKLEQEIAQFFGKQGALLFSTGFQANLGTISAVAGPGDAIIIDRDCHASIYDGCALSGAKIITFKHNDPDDLRRMLETSEVPAGRCLIITEGMFSVAGDVAPLREIAAVRTEYGAVLLVDEAHSFGTFGDSGRGIVETEGIEDQVDLIVGTFSKSVGTIGGFLVSDHPFLNDFRFLARAYLYSASLPAGIVAGARAAFQRIARGSDLRERLWGNVARLYAGLESTGVRPISPPSPVISLRVRKMSAGYNVWRSLLSEGILTNYMVPPATPGPYSVIRCSVSAAHTEAQIDRAIEAFERLSADLLMD